MRVSSACLVAGPRYGSQLRYDDFKAKAERFPSVYDEWQQKIKNKIGERALILDRRWCVVQRKTSGNSLVVLNIASSLLAGVTGYKLL